MIMLAGYSQESTAEPSPTDTRHRPIDNPDYHFSPLPPFVFSPVKSELVEKAATAMDDGPLLQLSTREAIRYD